MTGATVMEQSKDFLLGDKQHVYEGAIMLEGHIYIVKTS